MKISAVIITYNEEKNIGRCLKSLEGVADEIVILDSYSSDKTEEICKKYKAKFYQNVFYGHIEQKNEAIKYAKYKYVLSLDADEALSKSLKKSIIEAKKNFFNDGYIFNRMTNYCGKWIKYSGWYPDKKLRLWNKEKGKWAGENPHDKYELEKKSKIGFLEGDLMHYSYYKISEHIQQIDKFSEIRAKVLSKKGKKTNIFQIIVKPFWKFLRHYFLKLGFLDGYYGFVISIISAHATFLRYAKLKQFNNDKIFNEK